MPTAAFAQGSTVDETTSNGVRADFNGDGFADLAVGVPGEAVGSVPGAGAVNVVYGSANGLVTTGSQLFTQDTAGVVSTAEEGDAFGFALAAGDFDGDTFVDLAVAAPGDSVGTIEQAGAVNVLYGSASGLTGTGSQLFTQDVAGIGSTAEAFDNFGWALSAGNFDNDSATDLAIGAPFDDAAAVIDAGAINVLYGSGSGLTGTGSQLFTQDIAGVGSTAEAFDNFGRSLAAGDYDGDGAPDLAVGVPFETVGTVMGAGALNVLFSTGSSLTGSGSQLFTQDVDGIGSTVEPFDEFTWALAAGDYDNDGVDDLAIGSPTESVGTVQAAGAVFVLYGTGSGLSGPGSQLFTQDVAGIGSSAEAGDVFGLALQGDDYNGDGADDLAAGAPGDSVGTVPAAGAVNVLFGSASGLSGSGSQLFTQDVAGIGSTAEADDFFGQAFASGNFGKSDAADLAISAPTEAAGTVPAAGAVNVLYGTGSGLTGTGSQLFTQDVAGIGSSAEAFDQFGFAMAAL